MRTLTSALVTCMLCIPLSPHAIASVQDADRQGEQQQLATRVYSLQDVLVGNFTARSAPDAGPGGFYGGNPGAMMPQGGGAGFEGGMGPDMAVVGGFADPARRRQESAPRPDQSEQVSQVMELLMTTIEPESWFDRGGSEGSISYLDWKTAIVVRHRPAVHEQIADLLETLAQSAPVMTTQAVLVKASEAELGGRGSIEGGLMVLEADTIDLPTVARVRLTGFDGEQQTAKSGRKLTYIAGVHPVVAASSVGYQTQMGSIDEGLMINLQPRLAPNGERVTIAVDAQYTLVDDLSSSPATQPSDVVVPDRPTVDRRSMTTRLRVPVGQWVLVGSLDASADGEASGGTPLHLLIRIDAGQRE